MARSRHPNKEVEAAIAEAEAAGWRFRKMGHWGRIFCSQADQDGCQFGISGTPRSGDAHAKQIRQAMARCPHVDNEEENDGNV
jgi:hypothetical protein